MTLNTISESYNIDPVRAMEIWSKHPRLIIACLDAKSAASAYRNQASNPRDMSPDEVDWLMELEGYYDDHMRATGRAEKEREEREARMKEMESFKDVPF